MHIFIRTSDPFQQAADAYMRAEGLPTRPQMELCFFCTKTVGLTTGDARYRFVVIVKDGEASRKILVTAVSSESRAGYEYSFEDAK